MLNKTFSDQQIYLDLFHEKMFNQVWQREKVENQGLQKYLNIDENLIEKTFHTSFEGFIFAQDETNY